MPVRKFAIAEATFVRSPGQSADIFAANVVDHRDAAPISVGFGRYGPNQSLTATIEVDDVMVVLEGQVSVSSETGTIDAGPGEIVHMPNGAKVTIRSGEAGPVTAYVTYPHWEEQ